MTPEKDQTYVAYSTFLCHAWGHDDDLQDLLMRIANSPFGPGIDGVTIILMPRNDAAVALDPTMNHRNGLAWARSVGEVIPVS